MCHTILQRKSRQSSEFTARLLLLFLPLLFIVLSPWTLQAATINATTCSGNDVQTALTNASNGDIIIVPPGSCTWTIHVSINSKYLTLQGAGAGTNVQCAVPGQTTYTCITDGTSKSDAMITTMLEIRSIQPGGLTRITGITFLGGAFTGGTGGTSGIDPNNQSIVNVVNGSSTHFRFDHNNIYTTRTSGLTVNGCVYGLIDHNSFTITNGNYAHYMKNGAECGSSYPYGDGAWTQSAQFGSPNFMFIEDNTYTASCSEFTLANDGWSGMRVVFRYNTVTCSFFTNHGTMQRQRGARAIEVYNNVFSRVSGPFDGGSAVGTGSGASLIYNNIVTGPYGYVAAYTINRLSAPYTVWGQCNGTSNWDANSSPAGYACIDQPGRGAGDLINGDPCCMVNVATGTKAWPHQQLEISYAWGNTLNGILADPSSVNQSYIKQGRDYITSPMPGYVPFTYPHPLALINTTSSSTPPAIPTGVTVSPSR